MSFTWARVTFVFLKRRAQLSEIKVFSSKKYIFTVENNAFICYAEPDEENKWKQKKQTELKPEAHTHSELFNHTNRQERVKKTPKTIFVKLSGSRLKGLVKSPPLCNGEYKGKEKWNDREKWNKWKVHGWCHWNRMWKKVPVVKHFEPF